MKITLQTQERLAVSRMAKEFEKKTGEYYSIRFVMLLLAERYSERFEEDLKDIFDQKIRDHEEKMERDEQGLQQ